MQVYKYMKVTMKNRHQILSEFFTLSYAYIHMHIFTSCVKVPIKVITKIAGGHGIHRYMKKFQEKSQVGAVNALLYLLIPGYMLITELQVEMIVGLEFLKEKLVFSSFQRREDDHNDDGL